MTAGVDAAWEALRPVAVEEPGTVAELVDLLRDAAAAGRRVVPVGTGVDLRPGRPDGEVVVVRTRRMAGVEEYEPADLTLTAGAGTTLAEVADALGLHGQWLPFDPPVAPRRTLGGLAATGATGPLWCGYGAPRDHILGATLVTGDGRVLRLGGRVMKNVAGFDLLKAVVGSRGALGVVVSATVRVFPRPVVDRLLLLRGPADEVIAAGRRVATAPVTPASAVIHEPVAPGTAALLVRLHGAEASVEAEAALLREHLDAPLETVASAEAARLRDTVRDAAHTDMVVRASGLPAALAGTRARVLEALGGGEVVADPVSGRLRVRVADVDAAAVDALRAARRALEEAGGSLILAAGTAELAEALRADASTHGAGPASGQGPRENGTAELARALKARFDPGTVLWDGGGVVPGGGA